MKTESKTVILRNLRTQWSKELGDNKMDKINQEILKLSMKSGPISEKDITASMKKLCLNTEVSPLRPRPIVASPKDGIGAASAHAINRT
jgi:hypothetical protein